MNQVLVILLAATLLMTGCLADPPEPPFRVTLRLSPTPALIGPTRLLIDVVDGRGDPVTNAAVSVEGLPEERASGRAATGTAVEEGAGRYVVPALELNMGGAWTIAVTVTDNAGISMTRSFPISVYGGP